MIKNVMQADRVDSDLKVFLQKMPKVELHAHLNGSLSESTMNKLIALKQKTCPGGGIQSDIKFSCSSASSLSDCFRIFKMVHEVTDSPEAVKIASIDVITDFYNDGVRHLEIRSTPREVCGSMSRSLYVQSVLSAIKECRSTLPTMSVKLILSIDRRNPLSAAEETVNLARENFSADGDIVGIDLSGNPLEGNVSSLIPVLQYAKSSGLKLSLHMAETPGTSDEVSKLLQLIPDRIGHGTYLHPSKGGSEENFTTLQQLKIPLEICLTSNIISGTVPSYPEHHFPLWQQMNYPCVLCSVLWISSLFRQNLDLPNMISSETDDKGVFNTSLSNEFYLAEEHYSLGVESLWNLSIGSIYYSFLDEERKKTLHQYFLKEKDNVFDQLKAV